MSDIRAIALALEVSVGQLFGEEDGTIYSDEMRLHEVRQEVEACMQALRPVAQAVNGALCRLEELALCHS